MKLLKQNTMQNKSRKQCIAIAQPYFKDGVQEIYVTSDGQPFLDENRAFLHKNSTGDKVAIYTIKADEVDGGSDVLEVTLLTASAPKIKKEVDSVTDIDFLQTVLALEKNAKKPRKTVVDCIEARITELAKDLPVNDNEESTNQHNEEE